MRAILILPISTLIVLCSAATCWGAAGDLLGGSLTGAWTRMGELRVYDLLAVSLVLALVFLVVREIIRRERRRAGQSK